MIHKLHGYTKLAFSVVMLCGVTLTIAMISYQLFSPEGRIFLSLKNLWENHPVFLLGLGALLLLARGWINNTHPGQRFSNGLFYVVAAIGIVLGLKFLL